MRDPARLAALALALALAACDGGAPAQGGDPPDGGEAVRGMDGGDPNVEPGGSGCAGKFTPPADQTLTVEADGRTRTFAVHLPSGYDATRRTPVVFNFHGFTSNGGQQQLYTRMNAKADAAGFVAVHPEGIGASQSWNGGACCGTAASEMADDVALTAAILDRLEAELCVDPRRVYSTGMSNGGFMSHRLACELAGRIAAIAPVAGVIGVTDCQPARPVPVMQFHGTMDTLVPWNGSSGLGFPGVEETMQQWAARNGCAATPAETYQKGDTTCVTWSGCQAGAEVVLCTVQDGGHTWPGGLPVGTLGKTTQDIVATDAMWDFFQKHPLP
jgi:polyhydroxybutyrate depolymerase